MASAWGCGGLPASSLSMRRSSGPDILGRDWWGHVLNVLWANNSRRCLCNACRLVSVAGKGSVVGLVGGSARCGQSHGSEVTRLTSPSVGNLSDMPRSTQAV